MASTYGYQNATNPQLQQAYDVMPDRQIANLQALVGKLTSCLSEAHTIALANADRLMGPRPDNFPVPVAVMGKPLAPAGAGGELNELSEAIIRAISEAEYTLAQIRRFDGV